MDKKSLLSELDVTTEEIIALIEKATDIKTNPEKYSQALTGKTLLMLFEKPSLRTRLSFDVGMTQLGGHAIVMNATDAPLGGKESIEDTAKVCSRYVDAIMARVFEHEKLVKLRDNAGIPIINGLSNDFHPVQILSDLLTIKEKKGKLGGLKLCYVGDALNNITHSLLLGCARVGMDISVGCPKEAMPREDIVDEARKISLSRNSYVNITTDTHEAAKDADIIYADSWMSYHIPADQKEKRIAMFQPYQVNAALAAHAKKDFIFMNCLPAQRGYEQTADIIDGPHSVVFDQAENRLHMQKAILVWLLKSK